MADLFFSTNNGIAYKHHGNALISAYQHTNSSNFATVAVNNTSRSINQTFNLINSPGQVSSVTPWITSVSLALASQSPVSVSGPSFSHPLPAMSVVTFTGQVSRSASPLRR